MCKKYTFHVDNRKRLLTSGVVLTAYDEEDVIVTREELLRAMESSKDAPVYKSTDEMFRAILGDDWEKHCP